MHRIFQAHHIPPDEVYAKPHKHRMFMYASESIVMDDEEAERKKANRKGGAK